MIKNTAKKGTKTYRLISIYNWLQMGEVICVNEATLWIDYSERDKRRYIYWRCYGQSADEVSLQNLRWILKNIAKSSDYDWCFESEHEQYLKKWRTQRALNEYYPAH